MKGICVSFITPDFFPISQGTLQWRTILGKIGKMIYIQHAWRFKTIYLFIFFLNVTPCSYDTGHNLWNRI